MIIQAKNLLDTRSLYSYLSSNGTASQTTFPIDNINSFSANWAVQFGRTGEEKAEILLLNSSTPSGTAITTTSGARFAHPIDTPVFSIKYDKIIFKHSTTGTSGSATPFTGSTVSITPDSIYTQYDDTTALASYAFKACYYNSVTGDISADSDWLTPAGYSFYSLSELKRRVKNHLFSAGFLKTDESQIIDWINSWQEEMTNAAIKVDQSYSMGTTSISFGTAGYGTVTASDFKQAKKMEISYDSGVSYIQSKEVPINQWGESDIFTAVYPAHSWIGDTVFIIRPARSGGLAKITYYALPTILSNDSDELSLTLRPYTTGCIDYCLMRAYLTDQKADLATPHTNLFMKSKSDFIAEVTPRDQTGPKTIQFDDTLSGRADDFDLEYFTW